jgi:hypothetical protein
MFEIGPPVSGFLFELKRIGLLQQTEDDFFKIVPATRPIMDAMVTILSSAYTEELEDSKIDPAKISIALKEINASLQKMLEVISEKLSIQDYRKISGLD